MDRRPRRPVPGNPAPYVGELVLLAFAAQATEALAMGYGADLLTAPTFWFLAGFGLLMLVQIGHSSFAHGLVVIISVGGALLYLPGVSNAHGVTVLFVAFLVEAVALMLPPVQRHVHRI